MRSPLLFYLASARDPQRTAVGPVLAAAAERAGWGFDCYYDDRRRGRHFGGGDPAAALPGWPAGSLVAGGRHPDQLLWLTTRWDVVAVGDPHSILWPAIETAGCEVLAATSSPAAIYGAVFARLALPLPTNALVLDASAQGPSGVIAAPYLAPELLTGEPRLAVEVSADPTVRDTLEELGVTGFRGLLVDAGRAGAFPGGLVGEEGPGASTYAELTSALADRYGEWSAGVLLGDPDLVAAQLPRIRRLRLMPLYGQPQTDVLAAAADRVRAAREPVYGRQYDDHDFFELARLGHGLQVLDPTPPFDAAHAVELRQTEVERAEEPDDTQLESWAAEERVLVTLLFWTGMVRELECIPRLVDIAAETELKAGLLVTAETLEAGAPFALDLLAAPPSRGGVLGLLELLLASTGRGVAAEALLPEGTLGPMLAEARSAAAARLPSALVPRGWWPLLDARLVRRRTGPVGWKSGRPVLRFTPRGDRAATGANEESVSPRRDLRGLVGSTVRGMGLNSWFEERRPFDGFTPGGFDRRIADAARAAGFSYMWSKAEFGTPRLLHRDPEFIAMTLTAGNWDGWSPFYTVSSTADIARPERRLLRGGPGWLVGTIDSPLWALSGEVLERGSTLHSVARIVSQGGRSGRLVNVTPNVIARYARMLHERGLLSDRATSRNR